MNAEARQMTKVWAFVLVVLLTGALNLKIEAQRVQLFSGELRFAGEDGEAVCISL